MKKYMKKPIVAVAATVCLIGGVTPLLANANSLTGSSYVKVVMNEDGEQVTRYHLKELAENDPDVLDMLLKSQADHLYIVVDELDLDKHLQTYMEEDPEEWESVYENYYDDIWLEVRYSDTDEQQQIVSVQAETKDGKVYLKGIVTSEVTQVVVTKPDGDTITVKPTSEHTFAVSFTVADSEDKQYAKVEAYADTRLVDSQEVELDVPVDDVADLLIHSQAVLDREEEELTVRGLVKLEADEVYVTYDGTREKANVKKLWDGVGSFSVTLDDIEDSQKDDKVLLEFYREGKKLGSTEAKVEFVNEDDDEEQTSYELTGTAVMEAKKNKIQVKGTLKGYDPKSKASLAVVAPAGVKQTVKPNAKGEFTININLASKNRSFEGDAVELELYVDGELVLEKAIPVTVLEEEKGKNVPKGNAYGYWKNKANADDDDNDSDEDDDDDDDEDDDDEDDDDDKKGPKGKKKD